MEEEEAVVVLVAATEEEGAVAAWVDAEVWYGTPQSSGRHLLVRLLAVMVRGNFLLLGIFGKKKFGKTFFVKNHTPGALTSTMQATKMQRTRSFLYTGT